MPAPYQSSSRISVRVSASYDSLLVLKREKVAVPASITAWCEDAAIPFDLALKIEVDADGEPVCTSLQCNQREGGPAVTKTGLATIRLRDVMREAVRKAAFKIPVGDEGEVTGFELDLVDEAPVSEGDVYAAFRRPRPRTSHRVTDEHLREVASVYNLAVENGDPPTEQVSKMLYLTRPTAGRHVMKARQAGYITTGPRKGKESR